MLVFYCWKGKIVVIFHLLLTVTLVFQTFFLISSLITLNVQILLVNQNLVLVVVLQIFRKNVFVLDRILFLVLHFRRNVFYYVFQIVVLQILIWKYLFILLLLILLVLVFLMLLRFFLFLFIFDIQIQIPQLFRVVMLLFCLFKSYITILLIN